MTISRSLPLFSAAVMIVMTASAVAQNQPQQQIFLKDPTPRQPDLDRKYAGDDSTLGVHEQVSPVLLTERQKLIAHASQDLSHLATTLKASVDRENAGASLADEEKVAEMMETLAKNINSALKAGMGPLHGGRTASKTDNSPGNAKPPAGLSQEEQTRLLLQADSARLVELTQQLQTEVSVTRQDVLSVGALTRSAEIEALAKELKQRLKRNLRS